MKPLFFTIFSFLAVNSFAQNLELGLNYGIGYNSTIKNTSPNTAILMPDGPVPITHAPDYSIKGMYTYRKWKFGVSMDNSSSTYRLIDQNPACVLYYISPNLTAAQYAQAMKQQSEVSYKASVTSSYIPIRLFANRKFTTGRFENYVGVSVGYVFLPHLRRYDYEGYDVSFSNTAGDRNPFNKKGYYGLTAGAQIGSTYFITKRFGINAEVDADYIKFNQGAYATSYTYTYPVTAGIRYKL